MHKAEILRAAPACAAAAFLSPKERVGIAMEKKKRVSFGMFLVTIVCTQLDSLPFLPYVIAYCNDSIVEA